MGQLFFVRLYVKTRGPIISKISEAGGRIKTALLCIRVPEYTDDLSAWSTPFDRKLIPQSRAFAGAIALRISRNTSAPKRGNNWKSGVDSSRTGNNWKSDVDSSVHSLSRLLLLLAFRVRRKRRLRTLSKFARQRLTRGG